MSATVLLDQTHGANDLRILAFLFFVHDAKSALVSEIDDQLGKDLIGDTTPQLAVQNVHRGLA